MQGTHDFYFDRQYDEDGKQVPHCYSSKLDSSNATFTIRNDEGIGVVELRWAAWDEQTCLVTLQELSGLTDALQSLYESVLRRRTNLKKKAAAVVEA